MSALRLRGLTLQEIAVALPKLGLVNNHNGRPFSQATVYKDLCILEADWLQEANEYHAEHKARILAEIRELRRASWEKQDYATCLRALTEEADLFGLNAPIVIITESEKSGSLDAKKLAQGLSIEELEVACRVADRIAGNLEYRSAGDPKEDSV